MKSLYSFANRWSPFACNFLLYMKELADETSRFIQRQRIELESYISRLLNRHVSVQRFVLFVDKALDLFWSILW